MANFHGTPKFVCDLMKLFGTKNVLRLQTLQQWSGANNLKYGHRKTFTVMSSGKVFEVPIAHGAPGIRLSHYES